MAKKRSIILIVVALAIIGLVAYFFPIKSPRSSLDQLKPNYNEETRSIQRRTGMINVGDCSEDWSRIDVGFGSTSIGVEGLRGSNCRVYLTTSIEMGRGNLVTCDIPQSLGLVELSGNDYGVSIIDAEKYCT